MPASEDLLKPAEELLRCSYLQNVGQRLVALTIMNLLMDTRDMNIPLPKTVCM